MPEKCLLDFEPIEHREKYVGKRIKRGLFRSAKGILINADCNGSGNIIRKEIPDAFADGIEGVVVRPVRITPRGFYPCNLFHSTIKYYKKRNYNKIL